MGNKLRELREGRGWTHDEASRRMGVSRGHFIKLERGERQLTEHTIQLAARAFDVSRSEVLGDDRETDRRWQEFKDLWWRLYDDDRDTVVDIARKLANRADIRKQE